MKIEDMIQERFKDFLKEGFPQDFGVIREHIGDSPWNFDNLFNKVPEKYRPVMVWTYIRTKYEKSEHEYANCGRAGEITIEIEFKNLMETTFPDNILSIKQLFGNNTWRYGGLITLPGYPEIEYNYDTFWNHIYDEYNRIREECKTSYEEKELKKAKPVTALGFGENKDEKKPNPVKICPKCKNIYRGAPALSRVDDRTLICQLCGCLEAIQTMPISESRKREEEAKIRKIYENIEI